jgi:tetratricopeptide (TPR) repeat protein
MIGLNEARTLPRLMKSLDEFQALGGETVYCDTGSTDGSADVARSLGCVVFEEGDRFIEVIDSDTAAKINERFVVEDESPVVAAGERLFNFAAARNYAASKASNQWVSFVDCDEALTVLDLDAVNAAIADPEVGHLEYHFTFAHNLDGSPAIAFTQSKAYDRTKFQWRNVVHEVLMPIDPAARGLAGKYLGPTVFRLEHWQEPNKEHRRQYLAGLVKDCYDNPGEDRQSHYCAREMFWTGRYRSAIKEFERHIAMDRWPAERAQSWIFTGDAWGALGNKDEQMAAYNRAIWVDSGRREAYLRLAQHHRSRGDWQAADCYAAASLEIPQSDYYANDQRLYGSVPHEILSVAKGWLGDVAGAQEHLKRALDYEPFNEEAIQNSQFYFGYDLAKTPEGWMLPRECLHLFETAQKSPITIEVGSWKGRSTHALASGAAKPGGIVWAVDHFGGSAEERDLTHGADPDATFAAFTENLKGMDNVFVRRQDSESAAREFPNGYADALFIDAEHTESGCRADILRWAPKVRAGGLLMGHDFCDIWPGVMAAVRGTVGEPDSVVASIWSKRMPAQPGNLLLDYLTRMVKAGRPTSFVKWGDGEAAAMAGEKGGNCDGTPYTPALAWKLQMAFSALEKMAADRREGRTRVNLVPFADQPAFNSLLHRNDGDLHAVKAFWVAVREREGVKVFVGPERLAPAARMLRAEHFVVPLATAFDKYAEIKAWLLPKAKPGAMFIFSAGIASKIWAAELLMVCSDVSVIDAGSAFDPIFLGQRTRTEQLSADLLLWEYRDFLND